MHARTSNAARPLPLLLAGFAALLLTLPFARGLVAAPATAAPIATAIEAATDPAIAQEEEQDLDDLSTEELIALLKEQKERAERPLFNRLVKTREADAGLALVEIYDEMASPAARLRVIEALPPFTDLDAINAQVLDKLTDIATGDRRRLLRQRALAALDKATKGGRERLKRIVDSPADDQVRIEAMQLHVEDASAGDAPWYRTLWKPDEDEDGDRKKRKKDDEEIKEPRRLVDLHRLAFQGLVKYLTDEELIEALSEEGGHNLRRALEELRVRQVADAEDRADRIFGTLEADPLVRLAAAALLLDVRGDDFLEDAVDEGTRRAASPALRDGLADMVRVNADEDLLDKLSKKISKGKVEEKLFYMRACVGYTDDRASKAYRKLIGDREAPVRMAAMRACAERGDEEAVEEMLEFVEDADEEEEADEVAVALESISTIRGTASEWTEQLRGYTTHPASPVRVAALRVLADRTDAGAIGQLERAMAHEDWATRMAAYEFAAALRDALTIPMLIERLDAEQGRLQTTVAELLFDLTGQPFQRRAKAWKDWWRNEGADFEVISTAELRALEREREARRLELTTSNKEFFGIQIDSYRTAFVVDVSGSMELRVKGQYVGEEGEMRISVAKTELVNFLDLLEPGAMFNVIPFSDQARPIREEMVKNDAETLEEMKEEVMDLVASGGTNIYDGLKTAFDDAEIDTIVVLSDGEPTEGQVIDITAIRDLVRDWNQHRGVIIHTVQIGATFDLLRWLAEDHGGETVLIP